MRDSTQCCRSNKRLTRNAGSAVSLVLGFILLTWCAEPETHENAATLHHRFSSFTVLSYLLLSLLVMLGVLSCIADNKIHSRADVPAGTPQHAFAALAGLAGSIGLVFEKVRDLLLDFNVVVISAECMNDVV